MVDFDSVPDYDQIFSVFFPSTGGKGSVQSIITVYHVLIVKDVVVKDYTEDTTTPFEGEWSWEKNSNSKSFSLTITQDANNNLVGTYCYTLQNGDKVDCPNRKQMSFTIAIPSGNSFSTNFISSFSQKQGTVTISFDGTYLNWRVTQPPGGESYCPATAKLIKE